MSVDRGSAAWIAAMSSVSPDVRPAEAVRMADAAVTVHPDRLALLARRHAPLVRSAAVHDELTRTVVSYVCGHSDSFVTHHTHRLGDEYRCRKCGEAAALKAIADGREKP